jgi:adenylyl cyclase-associated protein
LFQKGLLATRQLVLIAAESKKPESKTLMDIIKPVQEAIASVVSIKDKNRPSPLFSHLSAVADGVPALGWVVVVHGISCRNLRQHHMLMK